MEAGEQKNQGKHHRGPVGPGPSSLQDEELAEDIPKGEGNLSSERTVQGLGRVASLLQSHKEQTLQA